MQSPSWIQLHAAVTHFPIALLLLALAVEVAACFLSEEAGHRRLWRLFSLALIGVAFLASLPSLLTGWLYGRTLARAPLEYQAHWIAGVIATVLSGFVFVGRWIKRDDLSRRARVVALFTTLAAATSVGWTGHLGGLMVFGTGEPAYVPVAGAPTPAPAESLEAEKLELFAEKMSVAADKMDVSMRRLEPRPSPPPQKQTIVVTKPAPAPVVATPDASQLNAAAEKLNQVADRYLAIADRLDAATKRLEAPPATAPPAPAATKSKDRPTRNTNAAKAPQAAKHPKAASGEKPAQSATPTAQAAVPTAAPSGPDPKLVAAGRVLYLSTDLGCVNCHQLNGAGGRSGPPLDGTGREHPDVEWQIAHLVDPPSKVPGSKMPAYDDLSKDDLRALATYLTTLK